MANVKYSRTKAIRAKCMDCSGNNTAEVRNCPCTDCALYPYRMGSVGKTLKIEASKKEDEA